MRKQKEKSNRCPGTTPRSGLSLVEILLVVAILSIVAASAVPVFQPSIADELQNAAVIVISDLEYARQLAVANNSKYQIVSNSQSTYYLWHTGTNVALNTLPVSSYRLKTDTATTQSTMLQKYPGLVDVRVYGLCQVNGATRTKVANAEFTSLGGTTATLPTEFWLSAGSGTSCRYLAIGINPVTGLATVKTFSGQAPAFPANP